MSARVQLVTRQGLTLCGPDRRMTAAEAAAWPLFQPYAAAKNAFFFSLDLMPPESEYEPKPFLYTSRPSPFHPDTYLGAALALPNYNGTETNTAATGFHLIERVGSRPFWAGLSNHTGVANFAPHPVILADQDSAKPVLSFGTGGFADNNLLSTSHCGTMRPVSRIDQSGAEKWDVPVFAPDMAWSFAVKFRFAAPNGVINGVNNPPPALPGGIFFGGASATGNNNPAVSVNQVNGFFQIQNKLGTGGYTGAVDLRDGASHTAIGGYDPVANHYFLSMDGGSFLTQTSGIGIIGTDAAALKLTIGGTGNAFPYTGSLVGCVNTMLMLPNISVFTDPTALAKIQALMAEK